MHPNNLFDNIFQSHYLCPQICKVRMYYNKESKEATFVPMVTFEIDARLLEEEQIFANFSYYNKLINKARYLIDQSRDFIESKDTRRPLYRLVWYLVNYLYGLSFNIRNSTEENNFLSFVPSELLYYQDLVYLFGPSFTELILNFLDSYYKQTIQELKKSPNVKIDSSVQKHERQFSDSGVHVPFDKEREKLYEDIKAYLINHIQINDALTNQMAAIFEGLYYCKEIPIQEKSVKEGIKEDYYKRLKKGFNYNQIMWILHRHGVISQFNENEADLKISLALDFLVDAGIQIPIFYYEREDGHFERAYRYGEDALSAKQYGYTIASVTKSLFEYMDNLHSRKILPKISFEKIGVILQENTSLSGKIDILRELTDPNDRRLIIAPAYSRHGKILHISDEAYENSKQYPFMFNEWCEREGIIQVMEMGITYSDNYFNKTKFNDGYMPKLVSDDFVAGLKRLATLLYHVDRCIDKSGKSNFLIALTACGDPESYIEALREELKLFFESPEYAFSIPLTKTINYLKNKKPTIGELEEIHGLLSQKSYSAVHGIRHKRQLWENFYEIKEEIERYFYSKNLDLKFAYDEKLKPLIDRKKLIHDRPMEPFEIVEKLKLNALGELCICLSSIFKNLLELVIKIHKLRRMKSGEIHKTDLRVISDRMNNLYESIRQWNREIEKQLAENFSNYHIDNLHRIKEKDVPYFIFSEYSIEECYQLMNKIIPEINNNYKELKKIYDDNFSWSKWEVKRMEFDKRYTESLIEIEGIKKAIEISKMCKYEDERVHPKVGAAIIKDDEIICTAYRGELGHGEHAEYIALIKKCGNVNLVGMTLITTLEPCTSRHHDKKPCAQHIVDKGIKKVIIGMLDPNSKIRGKGMLYLQRKGIDVVLFPPDFQKEVREINKEFWEKEWKNYKYDLMEETNESEWKKNEAEIKKDFYNEIDIPKIYEVLNKLLSKQEVRTLCEIYLAIDYDNLKGDTKFSKITSLIVLFKRENNIKTLLDGIKRFKPEVWKAM